MNLARVRISQIISDIYGSGGVAGLGAVFSVFVYMYVNKAQ